MRRLARAGAYKMLPYNRRRLLPIESARFQGTRRFRHRSRHQRLYLLDQISAAVELEGFLGARAGLHRGNYGRSPLLGKRGDGFAAYDGGGLNSGTAGNMLRPSAN